jgi:hypothetical protein
MTFPSSSEPTPRAPSDDELIDYLMGESVAERATDGSSTGDAAIEHWLAADEANTERLEALAAAMLSAALPVEHHLSPTSNPSPLRHPAVASSIAGLGEFDASGTAVLTASPAGAHSSAAPLRFALLGLMTLAAAIALAIFWSRTPSSDELSTDRVAIAWAETSSAISALPLRVDVEVDESWSSDWDIGEADDWSESAEGEAFAANNDSPPQWLLTALAQMTVTGELDSDDWEAIP